MSKKKKLKIDWERLLKEDAKTLKRLSEKPINPVQQSDYRINCLSPSDLEDNDIREGLKDLRDYLSNLELLLAISESEGVNQGVHLMLSPAVFMAELLADSFNLQQPEKRNY